jgi:hypothetical protein
MLSERLTALGGAHPNSEQRWEIFSGVERPHPPYPLPHHHTPHHNAAPTTHTLVPLIPTHTSPPTSQTENGLKVRPHQTRGTSYSCSDHRFQSISKFPPPPHTIPDGTKFLGTVSRALNTLPHQGVWEWRGGGWHFAEKLSYKTH